jgi:membrane protease YdiL (CAAX protease family)
MTDVAHGGTGGPTRFGKVSLVLFGMGMIGVLSLIPAIRSQLDQLPAEFAEMPPALVTVISLLNPAILLAVAVAVGTLVAHRVGLRSLVAEKVRGGGAIWPQMRPYLVMAIVAGLVFLGVTAVLDAVMNPFAGLEDEVGSVTGDSPVVALVVGVLYGGIVEELMLRWGFMSLLVWIGWRVVQRGQGRPSTALAWGAIVLAALLFGLGHLPALASIVEPTPVMIFRTVLLNALGGLVFGWLYWRHSLEVAMVSHAAFHVGLFVLRIVTGS